MADNKRKKSKLDQIEITPEDRRLFDFIGQFESRGGNYDILYGGYKGDTEKPLTEMTLDEVFKLQNKMKSSGSSAVGAHQFINKTLKEVVDQMNISKDTVFTPEVQDKMMAYRLRRTRGFDDYLNGKIDVDDFALNLSKEFASIPNPKTGRSYYDKDGLNKSLTDVNTVLNELKDLKKKETLEDNQSIDENTILNNQSIDEGTKEELIKTNESEGLNPEVINVLQNPSPLSGLSYGLTNPSLMPNTTDVNTKNLQAPDVTTEETLKNTRDTSLGYTGDIGAFPSDYNLLDQQFNNGGPLDNNMSPLTEFNTGGSHEENPLGGIPQGQNNQGGFNLVEEGETKYNGYIFSNDIKISKDLANRYRLGDNSIGKRFSDYSKEVNKQIEDRPYDKITKRTAENTLNQLILAQENARAELGISNDNTEFNGGGELTGLYAGLYQPQPSIDINSAQASINNKIDNLNPAGGTSPVGSIIQGGTDLLDMVQTATNDYEIQNPGLQHIETENTTLATGKGMLSGAAKGASFGSVVPGIGTAIGAGVGALAGGITSFIGSKKKNKAIEDNNDTYVKKVANQYKQSDFAQGGPLDPPTKNKNQANFNEASDYMKNWFNSPETLNRLNNNYNELGLTNQAFSDLYQFNNNINNAKFESKEPLKGIRGEAYDNTVIGYGDTSPETAAHELTHVGGNIDNTLSNYIRNKFGTPTENIIKNTGSNNIFDAAKKSFNISGNDTISQGKAIQVRDQAREISGPGNMDEIYPRIMELRKQMNAQPGQIISDDDIQRLESTQDSNSVDNLFKFYDGNTIKNIMNTVADNNINNNNTYAKMGGKINNKYPGGGFTKKRGNNFFWDTTSGALDQYLNPDYPTPPKYVAPINEYPVAKWGIPPDDYDLYPSNTPLLDAFMKNNSLPGRAHLKPKNAEFIKEDPNVGYSQYLRGELDKTMNNRYNGVTDIPNNRSLLDPRLSTPDTYNGIHEANQIVRSYIDDQMEGLTGEIPFNTKLESNVSSTPLRDKNLRTLNPLEAGIGYTNYGLTAPDTGSKFRQASLASVNDKTDNTVSSSEEPSSTNFNKYLGALNEAGRFAPSLINYLNYKNSPDAEVESYNRLDNRYVPQYIDEASLLNTIKDSSSNARNALKESSAGNLGALRSNIIASQANEIRALSDAMFRGQEYNNNQNITAQQFNKDTDMRNNQIDIMEKTANAQNRAAAEAQKNAYLQSVLGDIGEITKENKLMNILRNTTGYNSDGVHTDNSALGDMLNKAFNSRKNYGGLLSSVVESSNNENKNIKDFLTKYYG